MVQGLGFLSKKSWHVKNISNQKKVWEAEQRKAAEDAKTKELAKQIQQEREEEELERLAGKGSNRLDRGIDWMYQHQAKVEEQVQQQKQEEYLLGKEYVPDGGAAAGGDFEGGSSQDGVNAVVAPAAKPAEEEVASPFAAVRPSEPTVAERNEQFRMRHEDPMFLVGRQQHEKQKKIEQRQALFDRVGGGVSSSVKTDGDDHDRESRRRRKALKKERKRERKEERRKRRRAEYSDDSDDDDYERKRRRRKKSSRRDDERNRRHRRRSRSRSRSGSDNDQSGRGRHSPGENRYNRRKQRSRSRSVSPESRRLSSSRSPSPSRHHDLQNDGPFRPKDPPSRPRKMEGYGLQGVGAAVASRHGGDLGPDRQLLDRKRKELEERKQSAQQHRHRHRSSADDRARALREMQEDARNRTDARLHSRRGDDEDDRPRGGGGANFLHDMARESVMDRDRSRHERRHRKRDDYR